MDAVREQIPSGTLAAKVEAAQAELQHGIDRAGLRDDPFRHPLEALSSVIGLFPEMVHEMSAAVDRARQPVDPIAIERVEIAAATGAAQLARDLAQAYSWCTIVIAIAVVTGATLGGICFGYWAGRHSQIATEAGITAEAFRMSRITLFDGLAIADFDAGLTDHPAECAHSKWWTVDVGTALAGER